MKTAIVTGAGGGIGFECANQLSSNGYFVVGLDVLNDKETVAKFEKLGNSVYISGDITKKSDRDKLFDALTSRGFGLTVLVNSAGVAPKVRADILQTTEESYDRVMDINTKAMFFLTQQAANFMLENNAETESARGYIVNISSMSAYTSSTNRAEYCISKAGVSMITTLFADRLANEGILVNEIRPGIIQTPMTGAAKEKYDSLIEGGLLPIKRWGTPLDIAKSVIALTCGAFDYTVGQSFDIDGGFRLRRL